MQPLLSILIPSTPDRDKDVEYLRCVINKQLDSICGGHDAVEIIEIRDNKEMVLGDKRNLLYQKANGLYSVQWDSDDDMHPNAIELILEALNELPDCVTYEEYVNLDGVEYISNFSNEYSGWEGDGSRILYDGFHFHRTPFYKCVIRTEICKSIPIPSLRFGEDAAWSSLIKPLLKREVHIQKQIYKYIFKPSDPTERYGLNK